MPRISPDLGATGLGGWKIFRVRKQQHTHKKKADSRRNVTSDYFS